MQTKPYSVKIENVGEGPCIQNYHLRLILSIEPSLRYIDLAGEQILNGLKS